MLSGGDDWVEIVFESDKFREQCNNFKLLVREQGADRAKRIRRRLDDLRAAAMLAEMRNLPGRCHELKGDRAGQLSLDLDHPYRLIFEVANEPSPRKPDGGLDWEHVTAIRILGVEDTHE
jgi:plasmid maintenance system killer protein